MIIDRKTAETWAGWFRCLADPTRILLLHELATSDEPRTVGELVARVGVAQPTVSHHLRILADTCFVLCERRGTRSLYAINRRCLDAFPTAAELVMGRAPARVEWSPT